MSLYSNLIRSKFSLIIILFSTIAIYLPVIVFSHWGLFSDAEQIILAGRQFWADPWNRFDLIKGYWRPAFHILDLITYRMFGEKPVYFYLLEYLMFLGTAILAYFNCLTLSCSRLFSTIFALFWLISSTTLEVIYTLDKGEARIAFFLNLALFFYLSQDRKLSKLNLSDLKSDLKYQSSLINAKSIIAITISVFFAVFTKETSQIILVNLITLTIATFLLTPESEKLRIGFGKFHDSPRIKLAFFNNLAILFAFLCHKLFFYLTGGTLADNYLKIEYNLQEIYNSTIYYTKLIPDIIFILLFCVLSTIFYFTKSIKYSNRNNKFILSFSTLHSVNLTIISLAYFIALVNFRWKLVYIWFPINVFLIPATCYYFTNFVKFCQNKFFINFNKYAIVLLVFVFVSIIPARLIEAQAIFNLDALKDDLSISLVAYRAKQKEQTVNIVFPFTVPESFEIGERIEFFLLENFFSVSEGRTFKKGDPFRVFNFLKYTPVNPNYTRPSFFASYLNNTNSDQSLVSSLAGMQIFSYEISKSLGSPKDAQWNRGMLLSDMYLVVPYGELPDTLHFRGANLHQLAFESQLQFMPQVNWQEKIRVERSVVDIFGQKRIMGYKLLKITDIPPISWNLFTDGWLPRKTELFFDKKILNSVMTIQGSPFDSSLKKINFVCNDGLVKNTILRKLPNKELYEFKIDLTCSESSISREGVCKMQISVEPPKKINNFNQDSRELFFLVKKVSFS